KGGSRPITLPAHRGRDYSRGLTAAILRQAGFKMSGSGILGMELIANIRLEEGSYWADVPALPGCFAAGSTLDELFDSLREGVELYLSDEEQRPKGDLRLTSVVLSDTA